MLPIAIILTLFAAAALCLIFKADPAVKLIAVAAHAAAFVLSLVMMHAAAAEPISVILGAEPWNFYVLVTPLDAFMAALFTGVGLFIVWASAGMIGHDIDAPRLPAYYALMCALVATLCGVVVFENFVNVFLLVEASSFAAAGLVIIKNKPENLKAGLKYLSLSILGSSFILMGIIILYFITDALSITGIYASLSHNLAGNEDSVRNALIFITVGTALKSALFPLHIWLPDAHSTAPAPSSAILSGLVLKAYIFLYIKILHKAIGADILLNDHVLSTILGAVMITGATAMIAGSVMALLQTDIKRLIAYSSVSQIGYIFMGIGMGTQLGLFAAMFHILAHAVTKPVLFLSAGSIVEQTHNRDIEKMSGLWARMRVTMALFTTGALSMIGIPLFMGFNSKWVFAAGIIDSQHYWLLGVLAFSALLNGSYYLPIVFRAIFGKFNTEDELADQSAPERPLKELAPVICLASLIIIFALFSGPVTSYILIGISSIW
ncbi:MAG: hypothetical protein FWD98_00655 [Defluviitaleaceae bacterium]|nr:hypothetical protein [Defluviitaleaceae bacterium]